MTQSYAEQWEHEEEGDILQEDLRRMFRWSQDW